MSNRNFGPDSSMKFNLSSLDLRVHKGLLVGLILFIALIAFEIFNFDTTRFALSSLLGDVTFLGLQWAAILAVAFCAIDFAGLNRLFSPEDGKETREVWYLMGAWLLGATMNAVMTWWAVSVTLLNNNFGNEVLSREQLLHYVPIFVAVLVWLTRILFIGSLSIAGVHLFNSKKKSVIRSAPKSSQNNVVNSSQRRQAAPSRINPVPKSTQSVIPDQSLSNISATNNSAPIPAPVNINSSPPPQSRSSRVRQRPPMPNSNMGNNNNRIQASQR